MYYSTSKNKLAKHLLPLILNGWGTQYHTYYEPFVGGCSIMKQIPSIEGGRKIGMDKNEFLIALLNMGKVMLNGENPLNFRSNHGSIFAQMSDEEILTQFATLADTFGTKIDKAEYVYMREIAKMPFEERRQRGFSDEILGYAGFLHSYRGDFFQGYAGDKNKVDYFERYFNSYAKTVSKVADVQFIAGDYKSLTPLLEQEKNPVIIYADPPYKGDRYVGLGWKAHEFEILDYDEMYDTFRYWNLLGHRVFMSERQAPLDFVPIWTQDVENIMKRGADWKGAVDGAPKQADVKTDVLFALL